MLNYYVQELILYYIDDLNTVSCFYPFFKVVKKMYNPKTIIYDIIEDPKVMKVLLSDSRVDPSAGSNHAIVWASKCGHFEIVKLLLSDPRVLNVCDSKNKSRRNFIGVTLAF